MAFVIIVLNSGNDAIHGVAPNCRAFRGAANVIRHPTDVFWVIPEIENLFAA